MKEEERNVAEPSIVKFFTKMSTRKFVVSHLFNSLQAGRLACKGGNANRHTISMVFAP